MYVSDEYSELGQELINGLVIDPPRFCKKFQNLAPMHAGHNSTGHSGKILMRYKLSEDYANITREQICIYLQLCEKCQLKKTKIRKSLVVKPILSDQLNSRCQVSLMSHNILIAGTYLGAFL